MNEITYADFVYSLTWMILIYCIIQNGLYLIQIFAAWLEHRKYSKIESTESEWLQLQSKMALAITVIVPAFNEESTIVHNVRSLLSSLYPDLQVIVVNDGSTDKTLEVLMTAFNLVPKNYAYQQVLPHQPIKQIYSSARHPNLLVINKNNGGIKADACNAGLSLLRTPLVCVVDADSMVDSKALLSATRLFMEQPDTMVAVGGGVQVVNGCLLKEGQIVKFDLPHKFLELLQYLEYVRAFFVARLAWTNWNILNIISGAFGIFRSSVVMKVGGFSNDTVGEDYDLVVKIHRYMIDHKLDYTMRYIPETICWTKVPSTIKDLTQQRYRWHRGALEVFFKNIYMLGNPKYGKVGTLLFSYNLFIDVIGPIIEVIGYILIPIFWLQGVLSVDYILAYLAVFYMYGIFISLCTLILEEREFSRVLGIKKLLVLTLVAILENFGYRQVNNIWRVIGTYKYIKSKIRTYFVKSHSAV